jgi:hypothetical protein
MAVTEILYTAAAVLVGLLASARLTRLLTEDTWPPSVWVRIKWQEITDDGPWADLVTCPWCASPWIAGVNLVVALVTDLHPVWWIFNGWMAASLVVAWVTIKAGD